MTSSLKLFSVYFNSSLHKTNRFQVAMHLFSNRSQRMSKCGKNISDTLGCASCATFLFLPHFDVICGLLLNRCMETWNLFVEHILHTVLYTFPKVLQGLNLSNNPELSLLGDPFLYPCDLNVWFRGDKQIGCQSLFEVKGLKKISKFLSFFFDNSFIDKL